MGPSGSGKSTLMHIIGCLDVPTAGGYLLAGEDVGEMDEVDLAEVRNRQIGFVFQQFNLLPSLTAWRNVELPLTYAGVKRDERKRRAIEALERVGLADRVDHRPGELSGGQQQRVAVARALVSDPALILADEPTGNLDSVATDDALALFDELHAQGRTIVLITHELDVAQRVPADRPGPGRAAADRSRCCAGSGWWHRELAGDIPHRLGRHPQPSAALRPDHARDPDRHRGRRPDCRPRPGQSAAGRRADQFAGQQPADRLARAAAPPPPVSAAAPARHPR